MPSVLFVCTANICRSPMAAALLRNQLDALGKHNWRVESAGAWALTGQSAAPKTQQVLEERGLSASGHRARTVTGELLAQFDLILTMELGHKEAIQVEFPEARPRVFALSEMIGHAYDIPDPYGRSIEAYRETAGELEHIFSTAAERIIALAERPRP